jgi:NADP-dependent aldehyde dehydrogenase
LIHGAGRDAGIALVKHPYTTAVAFTGSYAGGRALMDAAAARDKPIPVHAEMGSTNPVFLLPGALAERADEIAAGYVASVNLGVGQFCTNPGLAIGIASDALTRFEAGVSRLAADAAPGTMLHAGICESYGEGIAKLDAVKGARKIGSSAAAADPTKTQAACAIYGCSDETYRNSAELREEVFGPASIVVTCDSPAAAVRLAEELEGHLTATIQGTEADLAEYAELVAVLARKVGRIVFNGFPTGVEVCDSMHHGGPFPAASDCRFTSVGTAAIMRFARPVCYQGFPDAALPEALRNKNTLGLWRRIDGQQSKDDV